MASFVYHPNPDAFDSSIDAKRATSVLGTLFLDHQLHYAINDAMDAAPFDCSCAIWGGLCPTASEIVRKTSKWNALKLCVRECCESSVAVADDCIDTPPVRYPSIHRRPHSWWFRPDEKMKLHEAKQTHDDPTRLLVDFLIASYVAVDESTKRDTNDAADVLDCDQPTTFRVVVVTTGYYSMHMCTSQR